MNTWLKIMAILIGIRIDITRVFSSFCGWCINGMIYVAFTFGDDAHLVHWLLIALAGDDMVEKSYLELTSAIATTKAAITAAEAEPQSLENDVLIRRLKANEFLQVKGEVV